MASFGDIAGRFASFAVPAGVALAGGGLNPQSFLTAAGVGAKGFATDEEQRRQEEALRKQRQAVQFANLLNTLNPGGNVQPESIDIPKPSALGRIASAAGTGVDLFQGAQQAQQLKESRDLQIERQKQEVEDRGLQRQLVDLQIGGEQQQQLGEQQRQAGVRRAGESLIGRAAADAGGLAQVTVESPFNTRTPATRQELMPIMQTAPPEGVVGGLVERTREIGTERAAQLSDQKIDGAIVGERRLDLGQHVLLLGAHLAVGGEELA